VKRNVLWAGLAMTLGIGLLAVGTWHCLGWMMDKHMVQGQLFDSQRWPTMLNLNAEQRAKLQPLEQKLKTDLMPLETELAMNQMALCRLTMSTESIDRKTISQTLDQIGLIEKRKEERVVDHLVVLRTILTADQQQKLFTTLMTDICRGCRTNTKDKKDHCGLCKMP